MLAQVLDRAQELCEWKKVGNLCFLDQSIEV